MLIPIALACVLALIQDVPPRPPISTPLEMARRFVVAVQAKDHAAVAAFVPGEFPIGVTEAGKREVARRTYNREAVLKGEVPFPPCDAARDALACEAPRASGRVTCTCTAPGHDIAYDFMRVRPDAPDHEVELVSIRDVRR